MNYLCKKNELGYYEAHPKPSPQDLQLHYSQKYFQMSHGTYAKNYSPEEIKYRHNMARVANETADQINLNPSLLDLGCGEGFFTKSFHQFGWQVSCCDYSDFGIANQNKDMLPYFSAGDIYKILKEQTRQKKYGMINLQNVLEHVISPIDLLNSLKPLLQSENSAIRIQVPNDFSNFQEALKDHHYTTNTWFTPPEHLSYFNKEGLINILHHCGYKIHRLQADFPIEIFLSNQHSNYWKDRSLGKQAHASRLFCQNFLIESNIKDYIEYSEASAKLGFGRELIAYASPH